MFLRAAALIALTLSAAPASAEDAPALSTISAAEVALLLEGRETGLAQLAEVHLWPGPVTVLEHAAELGLAPDQVRAARKIEAELETAAREVGRAYLAVEVELEEAFRSGRASKGKVTSLAMQSGALRAELRVLQLNAHMQMRPYLTREQLEIYSSLPAHAALGG